MAVSSVPAPPPPPPPPAPEVEATSAGVRATVLYDYEAEEENEMQLAEGDIITEIEQIDEGEKDVPTPTKSLLIRFV